MHFAGACAQIAYALTGEHHGAKRMQAAFTGVLPTSDWGCSGWGDREVAGHWSYLYVEYDIIRGGMTRDLALGLNWYLDKSTKLQFNEIHAFLDERIKGRTETNVLALRAQIDFSMASDTCRGAWKVHSTGTRST